jgi:hypothetical protein
VPYASNAAIEQLDQEALSDLDEWIRESIREPAFEQYPN